MKAQFLTELDATLFPGRDDIWIVKSPLIFYSAILDRKIEVFPPFHTDLASVPRLPIIYVLWGNRSHTEAVIHDYLFREGSDPVVGWATANRIFLEAMKARNKPGYIAYPMFVGVMLGSYLCYHKRKVGDKLA